MKSESVITPNAGETIVSVCERLLAEAPATAIFNGTRISANQSDTLESLVSRWNEERRRPQAGQEAKEEESVVYAIERFRTDTAKPGSFGLDGTWEEYTFSYSELFRNKEAAQRRVNALNDNEAGVEFSTYRFRVITLTVI